MLGKTHKETPTFRYQGDTAILVEFSGDMNARLIRKIHAFDAAFNDSKPAGVVETVPTYHAITIHIDPTVADLEQIEATVRRIASLPDNTQPNRRIWEVPVVYGGDFGCDLAHVAAHGDLTPADCIELHAATDYLVAMVGYLPGFSYLWGLPPQLATPRRSDPRAKIPASSISIGGQQVAIGSLEGPSGWHLIGRTPVRPFQPGRTPEFLFAPGDHIRFLPISEREWADLDKKAAHGTPVAKLSQK